MKRRILVIGLDGATFDVINPLINEGLMPNVKKLIGKGAVGSLQSTIPPLSAPAWLSLATGIKPEKTGVFDFLNRQEDSFKLHGVNSEAYHSRSVWDYLCQAGGRVGIFNYPLLRPTYKVKGFLTTGIGASPYEEFTFPKNLKQQLHKIAGGRYEITVPYYNSRYENVDLFLKDLNRVFTKKVQATKFLLRSKKWDLFWVVFSETDWLQHIMWRHIDRDHPLYESAHSAKHAQSFKEFWNNIDESIGQFCSIVNDDTNVIILSDHGFGPNDQVFKLNAWLEKEGYLVRKKPNIVRNLKNIKIKSFSLIDAIARKINLGKLIAPGLYTRFREMAVSFRGSVLDQIDLGQSLAFDPGHTIPFGGIYINNKLVDTHQEKQKLAGEIAAKLKDFGKKHGIQIRISRLDNIYNGPDLLIGVNDWRCVIEKTQFRGKLFEKRPYSSRHSGSHRMNGIFIIAGPDIQNVSLGKLQIFDIAPTLLYLFGQPIPSSMDGQVLEKIFSLKYLTRHAQKYQAQKKTIESDFINKSSPSFAEQEDDAIRKTLGDLGYL